MDIFVASNKHDIDSWPGKQPGEEKKAIIDMCLLNLKENDFIDLWIGQASLFCQL